MIRKLLLFVAASALLVSTAVAQPTIGVFLDQNATSISGNPPLFTVDNHFYVLALDVPDGMSGYRLEVVADPTVLLLNRTYIGQRSPLAIYLPDEWVVSLGNCLNGVGATTLIDYQYGIFTPSVSDILICVSPLGSEAAPVYIDCDDQEHAFSPTDGQGVAPDACALLYPTSTCGPFPTVFGYQLDDTGGPTGTSVTLPISTQLQFGAKCIFTGFYVGTLSAQLTWDPAVATFASVSTTLPNWTATASNVTPGSADISFTTADEVDYVNSRFEPNLWGEVTFITGAPGTATVVTTSNEVVSGFGSTFDVMSGQGSITVGPVATETVSFGRVKARY